MNGFVSSFTNRIDRKGRVSVPAPFRQVLARDGFEGLYCYPSLDFSALDCGGHGLLMEIERQLAAFTPFSEDHDLLSAAFYGASSHLVMDGEGRVALTDAHREAAGIGDELTFVGLGYKFQIWEPTRFAAHREAAQRRLVALRRGTGRVADPNPGEGAS
ncbi:division/cell wall cluster transcriptional repressor MraZ [Methylobrevis pamukkalensis]|uniref:Transcriptional regulator MraZ n=1 Tax=Methylobrevis pamukkalensis TaxID=1439726 RepID=A0A1E3H5G2_9HYPH|nr:cell division protein MraZ [Methylobrevis pamukkalensis]ODN71569.1 cell division protein MraZ [Methylobrevis pamukkalensis]